MPLTSDQAADHIEALFNKLVFTAHGYFHGIESTEKERFCILQTAAIQIISYFIKDEEPKRIDEYLAVLSGLVRNFITTYQAMDDKAPSSKQ